jgi:hypothetical protein
MHAASRRKSAVVGLVAAAGFAVTGLAAVPATAATSTHAVSINDPAASGTPSAGQVQLTGTVGSTAATTVLYVLDATGSTKDVPPIGSPGNDCNGDGIANLSDNVNGDAVSGDVLDCEIGAVRSLNANLASAHPDNMVVGVEAFAEFAQVASLNTAGSQIFAPPGYTGGEAQPRIDTAAMSVRRGSISRYVPKDLGALHHNSYDAAVMTALSALGQAPAGPKWIMLLSDGQTSVSDSTLAALKASGVHLSSFGVGTGASCDPRKRGALVQMSSATGEHCVVATTPGNLAAQLANAQPDAIDHVTVSIGGTALTAKVDAFGGWSVRFTLGAGVHAATATAVFTSGATVTSAVRSFTVRAPAPSPTGPPPGTPAPGTVAAGVGAALATGVQVNRPAPSRAAFPSHVTGSVGLPTKHSLVTTKKLEGARVLLQGRRSLGGTWATVGHGTVKAGKYSLHWTPLHAIRYLRVSLSARSGLAASSMAVPVARISSCTVKRHATSFSMTCHTTATKGSAVRLYRGSHIVLQTKVSGGLVKVHAHGKPGAYVLRVWLSRAHNAHHARLTL